MFDLVAVLADGTTELIYTYDLGDHWHHRIQIELAMELNEKNSRLLCVDGARACPSEDVGGPPGYSDCLPAIVDSVHPEQLEMWARSGRPFDPADFDLNTVKRQCASCVCRGLV